eukprot:COSAG01_NODE_11257_length_1971_cov_2.328526_2_plen_197_part_00
MRRLSPLLDQCARRPCSRVTQRGPRIDDYAQQVDHICCGPGGSGCRGGAPPTGKCSAACAVAAHAFATDCQKTLQVIMPSVTDPRRLGILRFESRCVRSVDPKFFMKAIMKAQCPKTARKHPRVPVPSPPPPPPKPTLNDGNIKAAVKSCLKEAPKDGNCGKSAFGPMASWDVSAVTDMSYCAPYSPLPLACWGTL